MAAVHTSCAAPAAACHKLDKGALVLGVPGIQNLPQALQHQLLTAELSASASSCCCTARLVSITATSAAAAACIRIFYNYSEHMLHIKVC
jgi:hypothetical protein